MIENFKTDTTFMNVTGQLVYLPIYLCSYYHDSAEYLFVINAQTGSLKGQRPYGLGKIGEFGKSLGTLLFTKKG